jgi:hypothetical protein
MAQSDLLGLGLDFDRYLEVMPAGGQVAGVNEIVMGAGIDTLPAIFGTGEVKERFP